MKVMTLIFCFIAFTVTGCINSSPVNAWHLEPVRSISGFNIPECAEVNPANGDVYVANIFAITRDAINALDGNGYISILEPGGEIKESHAIKGTDAIQVHGVSGMCFFNGYLYFNDRNNLKRCPLNDPTAIEVVPIPGTTSGFNDACCDDKYVYVSSMGKTIYRVDAQGNGGKFVDLDGVNGIKSWKGKLIKQRKKMRS